MKLHFPLLICFFAALHPIHTYSQAATDNWSQQHSPGISLHLPLGSFARTHTAGFGLDYVRNKNRKPLPGTVDFVWGGGADYFFGKKETVAGYDYRYGNYLSFYALAGACYLPSLRYPVSLMAGPSLGLYKGANSAGAAFRFTAAIRHQAKWSVGPTILLRQHINTKALWVASLRASWFID